VFEVLDSDDALVRVRVDDDLSREHVASVVRRHLVQNSTSKNSM
jgi:hypothetical protein